MPYDSQGRWYSARYSPYLDEDSWGCMMLFFGGSILGSVLWVLYELLF